jgi:hypothetical protein
MENTLSEFDQEPVKRPTLLTVLCILTFIGSGWSIASNIWAYSTAATTARVFEKNFDVKRMDSIENKDTANLNGRHKRDNIFRGKMMGSISKVMTVDNIRKNSLGIIISALLTLAGALLMWWLKRLGFYLYILGVVIGIIVPFYLYGNNLMAIGISSFSGFFGLVFIALYALNLKSMKS